MDRRICCRCTAARAAASSRGTPTSTSRCKTGSQPYLAVGFCRRRLFGPDLVTRFTKKSLGVAGATVSTRTRPCRQRPFKFFLFLKNTTKKTLFDAAHSSAVLCRRLVKRRKRKKNKTWRRVNKCQVWRPIQSGDGWQWGRAESI